MSEPPAIGIFLPGPVRYAAAARLQEEILHARIADEVPDVVLQTQHFPVVTLGRRGRDEHLYCSPEKLQELGIDFHVAPRGGDVTYHAPGQVVLYPILRLDAGRTGSHRYLHVLEEIAIRTAAAFHVDAFRREGKSGAWTASGKIAAIGFRIRRWVTYHGLSLNVDPDLTGFTFMAPCGIEDEPVASFRMILGKKCPPVAEVMKELHSQFGAVTGLYPDRRTPESLDDIPALREIFQRFVSA